MRQSVALAGLTVVACVTVAAGQEMSAAKRQAVSWVDAHHEQVTAASRRIWALAEPAFQETESSKLLADWLAAEGFTVQRGVADMPTAFVASYGRGKPVIAFLAEYDALPGLSQQATPAEAALVERLAPALELLGGRAFGWGCRPMSRQLDVGQLL